MVDDDATSTKRTETDGPSALKTNANKIGKVAESYANITLR